MIIHRNTFAFVFLLFLSSLAAQKLHNRAENLLEKTYKKMNSFADIELQFEYVLENNSEGIKQITEGTLLLQKDKYKLNFMGVTRIFDGQNLHTIVPDNEEVVIDSAPETEGSFSPVNLMSFYRSGYSYRWDILQSVGKNKKVRYTELIPIKKENIGFRKLMIGVDVKKNIIHNIIQVGKNGTKTTLTLTKFKTNQNLDPITFRFDRSYYEDLGYYIVEE